MKKHKSKLPTVRPGSIAFWMLNDASTVAEKIAYLRACHAGGVDALAMHPRSGNLTPYASREWYAMIAAIVDEGRRLNMSLWLYDEDPYPSGAAGGMVMAVRPDLKARHMRRHECPPDIKAGDLWCISEDPILWVGLAPRRGGKPARDLTPSVGMVRRDWFMTPWDSRYYYDLDEPVTCPRGDAVRQWYAMRTPDVPSGYDLIAISAPFAGEEGSWGSLPDLMHPDSFNCFRELSLEPYWKTVGKHYGKTIPGIFTDEAKPHGGLPVTAALWDNFKKDFGVELRPRLWQLFGPARDEAAAELRLNYRRWVNERFLDVFVRPYRNYCDSVGLRLVGHFSPEDDPLAEARSGISVMSIMHEMSAPGTDIIVPRIGTRVNPILNLGSVRAASVRAQEDTGVCISESLGLSGWEVTTQTCRRILAWQKVLGIDRFFLHGFYNSSEGVQNYEAPPELGPGSSIFAGISTLNGWLKGLESLMDGSREMAPVAVLNSMATFWTASADVDSPAIETARQSLWRTMLHLLEGHVGFHLADESRLAGADCTADGLKIGARQYGWMLVPSVGIIAESTLECLKHAVAQGVKVYWFGGGPRRCIDADNHLKPCPPLPGEILKARWPTAVWLRGLPRQADLSGADAEQVFMRRFHAQDGNDYLLAVNMRDCATEVRLNNPADLHWLPIDVDGGPQAHAGGWAWRIPSGGCGLFRLGSRDCDVRPEKCETVARPLVLSGLRFQRQSPNIARLTNMTVIRKGRRTQSVPFPKPYWQLFDDYRSDRTYPSYAGAIPIESRPAADRMDCEFKFLVESGWSRPVTLVLDPRFARGRFDLLLNDCIVRAGLAFPLDRIQPLRIPLKGVKTGLNRLVLRFSLSSAMDGVLSQLYLEGQFDVSASRGISRVSTPAAVKAIPQGWQVCGMPHYMGQGIYRWTENVSATDLKGDPVWQLELDQVVDNAELRVNGRSAGHRAWEPWRWEIQGLRPGRNRFELRVSGTAGNMHCLTWTAQPQGWIGGGRLLRRFDKEV